MKKYLRLISRKTKLLCIAVTALAAAGSALASVWPVKLGAICTGIAEGSPETVPRTAAAVAVFGVIFLGAEGIAILRRVMLDCIIAGHEGELREKSIRQLLKMPVSCCSGSLSGERNAQVDQGVAGLSQLIKIFCNDVAATVLTAGFTLYQAAVNAPPAAVSLMAAYLGVVLVVSVFQIRSQNGIREGIAVGKNALSGQICQSLGNLELIRSFNAADYETERLRPFIAEIAGSEKKHHRFMGAFDMVKQGCKVFFFAVVLLAGSRMVFRGTMPGGALVTVMLLFQQLVRPVDEVYRFMDETASSAVKARALVKLFEEGQDPVFSVETSEEPLTKRSILLRNAAIEAPESGKILAYYDSLEIPCDSVVAIEGESGCGKTTLMRCLTRYYSCREGSVQVFGRALEQFSQQELTELLVYIPQRAFFFAGTIRENLVYGLSGAFDEEALVRALRSACLYDALLNRVREKSGKDCGAADVLAYTIGEGGAGLSGGEGQRLALARLFLRKAGVFILDESTANLDGVTAEQVLANVEAYAAGMGAGVIYVSHDPRVVKRCRQVILLENRKEEYGCRSAA